MVTHILTVRLRDPIASEAGKNNPSVKVHLSTIHNMITVT